VRLTEEGKRVAREVIRLYEGTNEIQRLVIAREMLRTPAAS
jgi:alkylation response protein AidB-like acyl-CoA dehydrogenase